MAVIVFLFLLRETALKFAPETVLHQQQNFKFLFNLVHIYNKHKIIDDNIKKIAPSFNLYSTSRVS